jgi:predicted AAA+ superfamily ATPase
VNSFYSDPESFYYPRWLTPGLRSAVAVNPVVVLTGARQVGKSTLLRHAEPFRSWRYHTLDDFDVLEQARVHPQSLWAGVREVVLDEVQRAPELLSAVKRAVDEEPDRRFLLSGSANLMLMRQVSESLAGRAVYFVLHPMTLGELHRQPPGNLVHESVRQHWPDEGVLAEAPPDPTLLMLRGFMPRLLSLTSPTDWLRWWEGYVATYLERDLRQISQIDSLVDFRRVMAFLALRTGQLLNQSEVSRDAGMSQPTVHRYVNLLEASHLFDRLPSYAASRTTRLVKAPCSFWTDPGLAVYLAGYFDEGALRQSREYGHFFETLIYLHLRVQVDMLTPRGRLYFWRTQQGSEVDFVVEQGRHLLGIEVKLTDRPGYQHIDGLRRFLREHDQASGGLLIHGGSQIRRLDENIVAIPWTVLAGTVPLATDGLTSGD